MSNNNSLSRAKNTKNDEFYTQLSDIERELRHYKEHFRGKTVFCNCDDPYESNFFKYFAMNFNVLGLKKLICTCYETSPISYTQVSIFDDYIYEVNQNKGKPAYKAVLTEIHDQNGDGAIDLKDVEIILRKKDVVTKMKGDGDFRSEESIELLKEADIVVTNPPFSLFREYVAQLIEYDKRFLIIGSMNAITYKEIFPLIKNNQLWLGNGFNAGNAYFRIPNDKVSYASGVYDNSTGLVKFRNCNWFTNLDHKKRHEPLDLIEKYTPEKYPTYDNYEAINVDKVIDIPCDYYGAMGVPITFLDKYCPDQFEVVDANDYRSHNNVPLKPHGLIKDKEGAIDGKPKYARILIKRKDVPNHEN